MADFPILLAPVALPARWRGFERRLGFLRGMRRGGTAGCSRIQFAQWGCTMGQVKGDVLQMEHLCFNWPSLKNVSMAPWQPGQVCL